MFTWTECLKAKGLLLVLLDVNNLPKIDKIRYIAACNNAAVTGVSESKLDETILQSEIHISNYEELRWCDEDRNGGGVTWYVRSDIGYLQMQFCSKEIENIFEILFPKAKLLELFVDFLTKVTFLEL